MASIFQILKGGNSSQSPTARYQVAASATVIAYNTPLKLTSAGSQYVIPVADAEPIIGTTTNFIGFAANNSTNTASADGTVDVTICLPGETYLYTAKTAASINTQAKYNALVNTPVLFDLTSSVFTVDTDVTNSAYGLVITDLDISKYPGLVAFQVRESATILN